MYSKAIPPGSRTAEHASTNDESGLAVHPVLREAYAAFELCRRAGLRASQIYFQAEPGRADDSFPPEAATSIFVVAQQGALSVGLLVGWFEGSVDEATAEWRAFAAALPNLPEERLSAFWTNSRAKKGGAAVIEFMWSIGFDLRELS